MENRKYKTKELIARFLPYFRPYKKVLLLDLFCAFLTTGCDLILPMILKYLANKGTEDLASITVQLIATVAGIYLVLRIIDAIANYYMTRIGHVMGARIETDMRKDAFDHIQKLSDSYFNNTKVGQIMSRITNDLFDVTEFAHHCPEEFFIAGVKIVISFILLSRINIALTTIIFIFIPLMVVFSMDQNVKMKKAFKKQRVQIGELNARLEDSLLGVRVVKAFANEEI
ncbi:MAG: ABC transporter ATP-binding protein, partial [Intestinibacter sp.]